KRGVASESDRPVVREVILVIHLPPPPREGARPRARLPAPAPGDKLSPRPARGPRMDLTQYIRDIPDFPKPGILFKDITPLLAEPRAFRQAIQQMCEKYRGDQIDAVAAAEARG